jgi:hypothetical protein
MVGMMVPLLRESRQRSAWLLHMYGGRCWHIGYLDGYDTLKVLFDVVVLLCGGSSMLGSSPLAAAAEQAISSDALQGGGRET